MGKTDIKTSSDYEMNIVIKDVNTISNEIYFILIVNYITMYWIETHIITLYGLIIFLLPYLGLRFTTIDFTL